MTTKEMIVVNIHFIDVIGTQPNCEICVHPAFYPGEIGDKLSDEKTLNMNTVYSVNNRVVYSIVYLLKDLPFLDFKSLSMSVCRMIRSSRPNAEAKICIYAPLAIDKNLEYNDVKNYVLLIEDLRTMIDNYNQINGLNIYVDAYYRDIDRPEPHNKIEEVKKEDTTDDIRAMMKGEVYTSEEDDEEDEDNEDYDDEDEPQAIDPLEYIIGEYATKDKKHGNVRSSRVMKEAKNPKKSYSHHGLIVCSNKGAINKDKETIRKFLKEFIPGNSKWKKELRQHLLSRWMKMYTMTNKKMKVLEKEHRQKSKPKRRVKFNPSALEYSTRLFMPHDNWNNPNK